MRYLVTFVALGLCTSVSAQSVVLDTDSSVSTRTTIESSNASSVTNSVNGDTGAITSSIIGRTGSMCSAVVAGKRCKVACQAPQLAQCGKGIDAGEPSCVCR